MPYRTTNTKRSNGLKRFQSKASGTGEVFEIKQIVDNTDGFISLLNLSETIGTATLDNISMLEISNEGGAASEVQLQLTDYKNNSNVDEANSVDLGPGSATTTRYVTTLLRAGEKITLPNARWISYAEDASGANGTAVDDTDPHDVSANLYVDSTAATTEGFADDNDTTITFDDASGGVAHGMFRLNDIIRLDNEVCRITSIVDTDGDGAYTPAHFIVERALFGTAKADHTNNTAIRFPFFNLLHDYNDTSTQGSGNGDGSTTRCKTNGSGLFQIKNLFGYGRTLNNVADGIVPGSFYLYFRESGYQELGLTGIGNNTNSGLTSGTTYQFNITVDGGSAYALSFQADNVNFGGSTGIIAKINAALNSAFYATSGNLKDRGVICSITPQGDIRFTSKQSTAASAVLLADSSGGDTDIWAVGRIPAVASIEAAVASKFPSLTSINKVTGLSKNRDTIFAYDDGFGSIKGVASGSINYDSGELQIQGPNNSEFKIGLIHKSAHSGGNKTASDKQNSIISISARSLNTKWKSNIKIIARN